MRKGLFKKAGIKKPVSNIFSHLLKLKIEVEDTENFWVKKIKLMWKDHVISETEISFKEGGKGI